MKDQTLPHAEGVILPPSRTSAPALRQYDFWQHRHINNLSVLDFTPLIPAQVPKKSGTNLRSLATKLKRYSPTHFGEEAWLALPNPRSNTYYVSFCKADPTNTLAYTNDPRLVYDDVRTVDPVVVVTDDGANMGFKAVYTALDQTFPNLPYIVMEAPQWVQLVKPDGTIVYRTPVSQTHYLYQRAVAAALKALALPGVITNILAPKMFMSDVEAFRKIRATLDYEISSASILLPAMLWAVKLGRLVEQPERGAYRGQVTLYPHNPDYQVLVDTAERNHMTMTVLARSALAAVADLSNLELRIMLGYGRRAIGTHGTKNLTTV